MSIVTDVIAKNVHPIKCHINNGEWKYPINTRLESSYSLKDEAELFELSYRVTVHNRQVYDGEVNPINLDPPNFDVKFPLITKLITGEVNVAWGFYSTKLNILIIVFTGTYNHHLTLVDIEYSHYEPEILNNYIKGMKVHYGFWKLYSGIRDELIGKINTYVNKNTQIVITGFSLGGATSTLCTLDLYGMTISHEKIIHYSFASPRVFNTLGAIHYDSLNILSYRIANLSDMVPSVPLPIIPYLSFKTPTEDFMHVYELIYFDDNMNDYYNNHVISYLNRYSLLI